MTIQVRDPSAQLIQVTAEIEGMMQKIERAFSDIERATASLGKERGVGDASCGTLQIQENERVVRMQTALDALDKKVNALQGQIGDGTKVGTTIASKEDWAKLRKAGFILVSKSQHTHDFSGFFGTKRDTCKVQVPYGKDPCHFCLSEEPGYTKSQRLGFTRHDPDNAAKMMGFEWNTKTNRYDKV